MRQHNQCIPKKIRNYQGFELAPQHFQIRMNVIALAFLALHCFARKQISGKQEKGRNGTMGHLSPKYGFAQKLSASIGIVGPLKTRMNEYDKHNQRESQQPNRTGKILERQRPFVVLLANI